MDWFTTTDSPRAVKTSHFELSLHFPHKEIYTLLETGKEKCRSGVTSFAACSYNPSAHCSQRVTEQRGDKSTENSTQRRHTSFQLITCIVVALRRKTYQISLITMVPGSICSSSTHEKESLISLRGPLSSLDIIPLLTWYLNLLSKVF